MSKIPITKIRRIIHKFEKPHIKRYKRQYLHRCNRIRFWSPITKAIQRRFHLRPRPDHREGWRGICERKARAKDGARCKTDVMCGSFISVHHLLSPNMTFSIIISPLSSPQSKQEVKLPSIYQCGNHYRFSFNPDPSKIYTTRAKPTTYYTRKTLR